MGTLTGYGIRRLSDKWYYSEKPTYGPNRFSETHAHVFATLGGARSKARLARWLPGTELEIVEFELTEKRVISL